jgi:hypothetical protein
MSGAGSKSSAMLKTVSIRIAGIAAIYEAAKGKPDFFIHEKNSKLYQ